VEAALRRARRERRRVIASVTAPVAADLDLSAAVLAARRAGDRFFCLEQPDRERSTLAALGEAALVETTGENRFREAAAACRELARGAEAADGLGDPPGSGPVWVGGFAFAPRGGSAPEWASLAPGQLVLPELSLARRGDEARLTVTAALGGDESADTVLERLRARVNDLEPTAMPLLDPDPVASARVAATKSRWIAGERGSRKSAARSSSTAARGRCMTLSSYSPSRCQVRAFAGCRRTACWSRRSAARRRRK